MTTNIQYIEQMLPGVLYVGTLATKLPVDFSLAPSVTLPAANGVKTLTALGTAQNSTPTAAQTFGGILTQTSATGAGTVTFATGAVLSAYLATLPQFTNGIPVGYSFDCWFANLGGGQTLTLTAGASGMTMIGTVAVGTGKNALMKFTLTAANTWSVFCVVSA